MSFARRLKQFFRAMWREEQPKVRTNTVCQVVDYDGSTNLVSIQPCISVARPNGTDLAAYQLPVIEDIPVFQFGSGKCLLTVAPQVDSYGLYVISDRDLNNWLASGGIVDPISGAMHDISSGFFLPGVYPTVADGDNGLISPAINDDRIELRTRDGAGYVSLVDDGTIELNGNADWAVAYTDLKSAFDTLKSDFNTFVTVTYNLHNHPTAPVGAVSPPSVTGSSSAADMSGAKIDTIKVP